MNPQLTQILAQKRSEICNLKTSGISKGSRPEKFPIRNFEAAISKLNRINLIAEIKFASPSAGTIRCPSDPLTIAQAYEKSGASAISILTDKSNFSGNIKHLRRVKAGVSLPILRKDFILEEIQLEESRVWGADAVLLIARILSTQQLTHLLGKCRRLGLAALTEVHDREELERAVGCGADIIGINNRNLDTFSVDLNTTLKLAPHLPAGCIRVSESGIHTRRDVALLKKAGIHAFLVGTALMKSERIEKKAKELTGMHVA